MSSPEVTVVIPTWNRAAMLKRALESCEKQTFNRFEVIVCDNASTDATSEIVEEFARTHPHRAVRFVRHPKNIGPGRNWLSGVRQAQSPFIKVLFSDDELTPNSLAALVGAIQSSEASAIFGRVHFMWKNSFLTGCKILSDRTFGLDDMLGDFFSPQHSHNNYPVSPGAGIFRKDCISDIDESTLSKFGPYNIVDTGIGIDVFWYLCAWRQRGVKAISDIVAKFHGHEGSITVSSGHERLDKHNLSSLIYRAKMDANFAEVLNPWLAELLRENPKFRNVSGRKRVVEELLSKDEQLRLTGQAIGRNLRFSWRKYADMVVEKVKLRFINSYRT